MDNKPETPVSQPVTDAIVQLCDGNPSAIGVMLSIIANMPSLFPTAFKDMSLTRVPEIFNDNDIFGRDIHLMYAHLCGGDLSMVVVYALALEAKLIGATYLRVACDDAHNGQTTELTDPEKRQHLRELVGHAYPEFLYLPNDKEYRYESDTANPS